MACFARRTPHYKRFPALSRETGLSGSVENVASREYGLALYGSAELYSAERWEIPMCGTIRRPAEYNSAIQQIENQLCSAEDLL